MRKRVEPKRSPNIDPLGAVVQLVRSPPQPVDAVHGAVPEIDPQLIDKEPAGHLQPQRQLVSRDQAVLAQQAIPHERRIGDDCKVGER